MPNDTDLTVFDRAGHAGLDLANSHGLTHYHTPMDSYERADPRSLHQQGSTGRGQLRILMDVHRSLR